MCLKRPKLFIAKSYLKVIRLLESVTRVKLVSQGKLFQEMEAESISKSFDQPIDHLFEHRTLDELAFEFDSKTSGDVVSVNQRD